MQKQPLILLLFVFCCAYHFQPTKAVNCSTITDCRTCTSASDFLVPCQWCLLGRHCESGWSIQSGTRCPHNERILNAYNCPISPSPKQPFLDEFARSRVLPFIAALNADNQQQIQICLENNVPTAMVIRHYVVPCEFIKSECAALLTFVSAENSLVLTFKAVNGAVQVLTEALNLIGSAQKDFEPIGGKVISQFYDTFFSIWKGGLDEDLRRELQEEHPGSELWVFGHSLGGSLASLAASWIAKRGIVPADTIKFVSFGQPRTGNLLFAQHFDELIPQKYRVIHSEDLVARLPPRLLLSDEHSLYHHRYEVWYNNDMTVGSAFEICESADGIQCSGSLDSKPGLGINPDPMKSFISHLHYYNVSLMTWFRSGCASRGHLKIKPRPPIIPQ